MARLFQYGYLDRQRHKGSNEYEYKAGKRIATVQKTYGKRLKSLANKRKLSPRVNYNATPPLVDVATPIAGGSRNIGLTISSIQHTASRSSKELVMAYSDVNSTKLELGLVDFLALSRTCKMILTAMI